MKIKRKILSILLSLIFIFQMINNLKINSLAAGGYFTNDSFTLTPNAFTPDNGITSYSAYTMQDDSGLLSGFYYYMKVEDGKAICCDGGEVITNILNYKIGVAMSAQSLATFIQSYTGDTVFTGQDPNYYNNCKPVLKNGSLVGIALNDLSGCRMAYSEETDNITIPNTEVNNIYNYFLYYQVENPIVPDFVVIPTASQVYCNSNWTTSTQAYYKSIIEETTNVPKFGMSLTYWTGGVGWYYASKNAYRYFSPDDNSALYVAYNGYNDFCTAFELDDTNFTITFDQFAASTYSGGLSVNSYTTSGTLRTVYNQNGTANTGTTTSNQNVNALGSNKSLPFTINGDSLTIYKTLNIFTQIQNNTYQKTYYTSNNYKNYSVSNDNSYNTNVQNINNSSTNNTNIYNQSSTETNTNIQNNNYNVDNSVNDNSVTTIINNYYGDNGSGDGGDDNDDDDDDSIWKALLKAIAGFFEKIGELIATLLTGIFSIFTSILDAITSITEDFTSITSFISSFFSWLPAPITSLIVLGLGLALICAFLTWFKK